MKTLIFTFFLLIQFSSAQVIHKKTFDRFSHYDAEDWITYAYSNHITSIDLGTENVYFGTSHGGILRYNFFSEEWLTPQTTSNGLKSNKIRSVVFDAHTDQLYALTKKGIQVYNKAFQYWQSTHIELPTKQRPDRTNLNNTDTRLPALSRPNTDNWPTFFPQVHYEVMLDGTIYNPDNEEYTFTDRVVDRWHKFWIGTNGTGIAKADLDMQELRFIKQSISTIRPNDVFIDDDNIWIGGSPFNEKGRGIVRWNYEKNTWDYFKSGINYTIFSDNISVIEGIDDEVFFGTEQGLLQFDTKNKTWKSLQKTSLLKNDAIFDLFNLNSILYIASENGAFKYDPYTGSMQSIGKKFLHQRTVNKITGSGNTIYLATDRGVFEYNTTKNETLLLNSRAAIADNFIDVVGVKNDTLWFAGQNGIGYYDKIENHWKSFPTTSLRFNSKFSDIAFTQWYVWFATERGLLRYDIDQDYWYLYTKNDGLADNRVYNIDVDGDYLWLSTFGGVTQFKWYREGRWE